MKVAVGEKVVIEFPSSLNSVKMSGRFQNRACSEGYLVNEDYTEIPGL
jgi:hypothetical protein